MSATPSKLSKSTPYIGTHDNTFHCDDVTACHMLKSLTRFKDHDIVRTRDPKLLAEAEIIVDVGGELDLERLRLDHHQRSFNQTIKDYHPNIKTTNPNKAPRLSSAGLVYAIFGKDYIVKQLGLGETYADLEEDQEKKRLVEALYAKIYVEIMEEIDAIDNGVEIAEGSDLVYNYHINSGISNRVARFNPTDKVVTPEQRLVQFYKAMEMVGAEMTDGLKLLADVWWPRRQLFRDHLLKRHEFDPSGQIVLIESEHLVGWKSSIYELEEEMGIVGEVKFVVFNDGSEASPWRATGVPVELKSFTVRVPYKSDWCGKRDAELREASGVPDATFVHMNGFTGGALSKEGIKSMVRKSLGLE